MSANGKRATDDVQALDVTLLGRSYRVSCAEDEREALMQAVSYLEGKMNEIKKAGKVAGAERIAVMAALNVAHELLSMRLGQGFDLGEAKRRIASMEARLEAVLAKQEKLF